MFALHLWSDISRSCDLFFNQHVHKNIVVQEYQLAVTEGTSKCCKRFYSGCLRKQINKIKLFEEKLNEDKECQ